MEEIRDAQQDDEMVQRVIHILTTNNRDAVSSKTLWPFLDKIDELFLDEQILY